MSSSRDVRRTALQALYQFDSGRSDNDELEMIRAALAGSPGTDRTREDGLELARAAWAQRENADRAVAAMTPAWPTHRQPIIDRNILRLAYHEMTSGRTPPKVAINEAVELAKEFGTEKSPMFINGVLDKVYRSLRENKPASATASSDVPNASPTNEHEHTT